MAVTCIIGVTMNKPTFSIIVPVYNTEAYLRACLDSIVAQTYADFEVIMVDDGSDDGSPAICKEYAEADSRFSYYFKENGGVSSARNLGIERARGEWLLFVDADDILNPCCLQTLNNMDVKADITFFGMTLFNERGTIRTIHPEECYSTNRSEIEAAIYSLKCGKNGDIFGWTWDKVFRSDIIKRYSVSFAEDISFREDEIFTLDYCCHIVSLRVMDKSLYNYRIHSFGLTSRGLSKKEFLPSSIRLEKSLKFYSHLGLYEHILNSVTDYRAKDIYYSPLRSLSGKLHAYADFVSQHPQPAVECKVNHLTQYLKRAYWLGFIYCLIRRL